MNEGLASYTGVVAAAASREQAVRDAVAELETGSKRESFVRWFAYASGPAYGLLLDDLSPGWRKSLKPADDLGKLLLIASGPPSAAETAAAQYGGPELMAAERARDAAFQKRVAAYRRILIDGPVLALPASRNSSSNTNGMIVLPGAGTVFTIFRAVADWGILEVTNGAVLTGNQRYVVPAPAKTEGRTIAGEGWTLTLNLGWSLKPAERAGDFVVSRVPER